MPDHSPEPPPPPPPNQWQPDNDATARFRQTIDRVVEESRQLPRSEALRELIRPFSAVLDAHNADAEYAALVELADHRTSDLIHTSFSSQPQLTAQLLTSAIEYVWRATIPGTLVELSDSQLETEGRRFVDGVLKTWKRVSSRIISSLQSAAVQSISPAQAKASVATFIRTAGPLAVDLLASPEKAQVLDIGTSGILINMLNWSGDLLIEVLDEIQSLPTPHQLGSILLNTTEVLSATNFLQAAKRFRPDSASEDKQSVEAWDRDFFGFVKDERARHRLSVAWGEFDPRSRAASTSELLAGLAMAQPGRAKRFKYTQLDAHGKPPWLKPLVVRPHPPCHDAWFSAEELCVDVLSPELSQGSQSQTADSIELHFSRDDVASIDVNDTDAALVIKLNRPLKVQTRFMISKELRLHAVEEDLAACVQQMKDLGWRFGHQPVAPSGETTQEESSRPVARQLGPTSVVLPKELVEQLSNRPPLPQTEQRASIGPTIELDNNAALDADQAAAGAEDVDMADAEGPPSPRPPQRAAGPTPSDTGGEDEIDLLQGTRRPASRTFQLDERSEATKSVTTASRHSSTRALREEGRGDEGEEEVTDPSLEAPQPRRKPLEMTRQTTQSVASSDPSSPSSEHEPSGPELKGPPKSPGKPYQSRVVQAARKRLTETRRQPPPTASTKSGVTTRRQKQASSPAKKSMATSMQGREAGKQGKAKRQAASSPARKTRKGGKKAAPPMPSDSEASTVEEEEQPTTGEDERVWAGVEQDLEGSGQFGDDDIPPGGKPPPGKRKWKGTTKTPSRPRPVATAQAKKTPPGPKKKRVPPLPVRRSARHTAVDEDEEQQPSGGGDGGDEGPLSPPPPRPRGRAQPEGAEDTAKGAETTEAEHPDPAVLAELEARRPLPLKATPGKKMVADWMSPANQRATQRRARETFAGAEEEEEVVEQLPPAKQQEQDFDMGRREDELVEHEQEGAGDLASHFDAPDMGGDTIDLTNVPETDSDLESERGRVEEDGHLRSGTTPVEPLGARLRESSPASPSLQAGERRTQSQQERATFREEPPEQFTQTAPPTIDPRVLQATVAQVPPPPAAAPKLLSSPRPSIASSAPGSGGVMKRKSTELEEDEDEQVGPPPVSQMPTRRREMVEAQVDAGRDEVGPPPKTPGPQRAAPVTSPATRVSTPAQALKTQPASTPAQKRQSPRRPFQTEAPRILKQVAVATSQTFSEARQSPDPGAHAPAPVVSVQTVQTREDEWLVVDEEERRALHRFRESKRARRHVGRDSGVAGMTMEVEMGGGEAGEEERGSVLEGREQQDVHRERRLEHPREEDVEMEEVGQRPLPREEAVERGAAQVPPLVQPPAQAPQLVPTPAAAPTPAPRPAPSPPTPAHAAAPAPAPTPAPTPRQAAVEGPPPRPPLAERQPQAPPSHRRPFERPLARSSPIPGAQAFNIPFQTPMPRPPAPQEHAQPPSPAEDGHTEKERLIMEQIQQTARRITDALVHNVVTDAKLVRKETRGATHRLFSTIQTGLDGIRERSANAFLRVEGSADAVKRANVRLRELTQPRQAWQDAEAKAKSLAGKQAERGRAVPDQLFG